MKLRVHKQGCNAANKSVHLGSPLLLLKTQEAPSSLFNPQCLYAKSGASFLSKGWLSVTAPHWYHTVLTQILRNEVPAFVFLHYDNPKFINLLSSWKNSHLPGQTKKPYQVWWIKTLLEKKVCDGWASAAALVPSWTLQHPVWVTAGPTSHRGQLPLQNNAPCFAKHIKCHC